MDPQPSPTTHKDEVLDALLGVLERTLGLNRDQLDLEQPFLELGVSSMELVAAFSHLQETFGVRPSMRRVFQEFYTLDRLAGYLAELIEARKNAPAAQAPAEAPEPVEAGRAPLTDAQEMLRFLAQYSQGGAAAFQELTLLEIQGPLAVDRLITAWARLVARHEALRASLDAESRALRIGADGPPLTLAALPAGDPQTTLPGWLGVEAARPLELERALVRAVLLPISAEHHLLAVTAHELIADRPAVASSLAELGELYSAELEGREPILARAGGLAEAAAAWVTPGSEEARASTTFWRERFADGLPRTDLPLDHARPAVKSYRGQRLVLVLSAEETATLRQWAARHHALLSFVLLAVFEAWLYHTTGEDELVIGAVARGGVLSGPPTVAARCNPQPLRLKVNPEAPLGELLRGLQGEVASLSDHTTTPFARVVRDLDPARDQSRSPIFTIGFSVDPVLPTPSFFGARARWAVAPVAWSRYDLDVQVTEGASGLQIGCTFATDLFLPETVRRWMTAWRALIRALPSFDDRPVAQLPILGDAEAKRLDALAVGEQTPPSPLTVVDLIEAQAARTPSDPALYADDEVITHGALHAEANRVAHRLHALGVGRDDRVLICMDRSPGLISAILGVLKAGGAYVPVDPAWPEARRALIERASGARVALVDRGDRLSSGQTLTTINLSDPASLADLSERPPTRRPAPDDLAYVLFTSGSTGQPKGVAVPHRGVVNLLLDCERRFDAEDRRGVLASTSVCFDISVFELMLPLCFGGALVLAQSALELPELTNVGRVTLINTVPSAMAELVESPLPTSLRVVVLGGEPVHEPLVARVFAQSQARRVLNGYGPTETTIYTTFDEVHRDAPRPMTIGRPVTNNRLYVLNRHGGRAPLGAVGELWVGGPGVARGYLDDPARSTERFVWDPSTGERLYNTGDLARFGPDGRLIFLGRRDGQIKLRGYRVELGEIEAALSRQPGVREAVALVRPGVGDSPTLFAWVARTVAAPGPEAGSEAPDGPALIAALRAALPSYAVPSAIAVLDTLPRLPNGKLHRDALVTPTLGAPRRARVAPRDASEALMVDVWARVLGVSELGVEDDFFELGGDSLLITPLLLGIRDAFDARLSVRSFFKNPTVAGALEAVYHQREQSGVAPAPFDQASPEVAERYARLRQDVVLDPTIVPEDAEATWVERPRCVFVTGATGFLGAHLMGELLTQTDAVVLALVRADDPAHGVRRVIEAMRTFDTWDDRFADRIEAVVGELSRPLLGLSPAEFNRVAERADLILHNGAVVNFIYPYTALKPVNVDGTHEVIRLAFRARRKPLHFISTVAVLPMGAGRRFMEEGSLEHGLHLNMAYDESKWVAEQLVHRAADRGLQVAIYRPGEVSGHSRTGHCVPQHFLYAVLAGSARRGEAPRSSSNIDLTPVDYTVQAIVWMARQRVLPGRTFHIVNPAPLHISRILDWARSLGYQFRLLPLSEWRDRLLADPDFNQNPLYPFAAVLEEFHQVHLEFPDFDCTNTLKALEGSGVTCPPVAEPLLRTYLNFFIQVGFLPPPPARIVE